MPNGRRLGMNMSEARAVSCRTGHMIHESMGWLPQQAWGLFLMASTPLPATKAKQFSFGQPPRHNFRCIKHVPLPW